MGVAGRVQNRDPQHRQDRTHPGRLHWFDPARLTQIFFLPVIDAREIPPRYSKSFSKLVVEKEMSQALRTPAGQTVVQVSERYDSGTVTLSTANTSETSLVVLNTGVWREGVLLIKVTTLSATTPQLIVNVWALDNSGN